MPTPNERLDRMRKSFEKNRSMLAYDYAYFTTTDADATPRVPIPRNKVARKSAGQSEPQSREPIGMRSSDKTVD